MRDETVVAEGAACAEEGRRLFYDKVGRYFYDEELPVLAKPLPCSVCGAMLERGFVKDELVQCKAQRSILSKRAGAVQHGARKEKKARKDGTVAKERGFCAFNETRRGVLVTPSRTHVVVNIQPVGDLPPEMEWSSDGSDAVIGRLYEALLDPALELPALFVMFDRRADGPFVLTRSRASVTQCGGGGTKDLDIPRVASILRLADALGLDDFERLVRLKGRLVLRNATEADREAYLELLGRVPRETAAVVPNPEEPAMEVVRSVIKSRRLARAA